MKNVFVVLLAVIGSYFSCSSKIDKSASSDSATDPGQSKRPDSRKLFLDVHNLEPGKISLDAVAEAHQTDLLTLGNFGVNFTRYWVDEEGGKVYCLVEAPDSASIYRSHKEPQGLVPDLVEQVTAGRNATFSINRPLFLDVHELGPGKVTEAGVAAAHAKDFTVQSKYDVNFVNYWADVGKGTIRCLQGLVNSAWLKVKEYNI